MQQQNKRFTDEAFELWKDVMRQINIIDLQLHPDELSYINSGFCIDDDDFYITCKNGNLYRNIAIFDDGSLSFSCISSEPHRLDDFRRWFNPEDIYDLSVIVEEFLKR